MAAKPKFHVVRIPTDAVNWKPVISPQTAARCVIENFDLTGVNMRFRVDKDDGGTEKQIPSGQELDINTYGRGLCNVGEIIGYVLSESGVGPAVITWTV